MVSPREDQHGFLKGFRVLATFQRSAVFVVSGTTGTGASMSSALRLPMTEPNRTGLERTAAEATQPVPPVRSIESATTARLEANVALDGTFSLTFPSADQLRSSVTFLVFDGSGEQVGSITISADQLKTEVVRIEIAAQEPPIALDVADALTGKRVKVTGYIVDKSGRKRPSSVQVLFQGRTTTDGPWQNIAVVNTGRNGFFSVEVPNRPFVAALARVGIVGAEPIPLPIDSGRIVIPIILPVENPVPPPDGEEDDKDTECCCHESVGTPVDIEDLAEATGSFSSDVGGGKCVEFTIPNRCIEEFSYSIAVRTGDPQIRGMNVDFPNSVEQLNELIAAEQDNLATITAAEKSMLEKVGAGESIDPQELSLIRRNRTASTTRISNLSQFRSVLQNSPQRLVTRASVSFDNAIDWDADPTVFQATTVVSGHVLYLKQAWCSDGYSLGDLLYSLPLAPCQKKQIAIIDWERRETAKRSEDVAASESLESSLVHNRDITETVNAVVQEKQRGFSIGASTGGSAGWGGFAAGGFLGIAAGLGVAGSVAKQNSNRTVASSSLQQLRDSTLQASSAFRSQRSTVIQTVAQTETSRVQTEVVANHNHCHSITIQYFEVLRHFKVVHELAGVQECLFIPLLLSQFDPQKILRWRDVIKGVLIDKSLAPDLDAVERHESGLAIEAATKAAHQVVTISGEMLMNIHVARPPDKADGTFFPEAWAPLTPYLAAPPEAVWNSAIKNAGGVFFDPTMIQLARDQTFAMGLARQIAATVAPLVHLGLYGSPPHRRVDITFSQLWNQNRIVHFETTLPVNQPLDSVFRVGIEFEALPSLITVNIYSVQITAKNADGAALFNISEIQRRTLAAGGGVADNHVGTLYSVPSTNSGASSPVAISPQLVDLHASERLLTHLNANLEYYHRALWLNMDPDRRYLLLDGFLAPNGRSLASVVENRVIGIAGNSIIMPVAPGFELDPLAPHPLTPEELLGMYEPLNPPPPVRVSYPTGGVFAESVMGSCNSCEKRDENFWCPGDCPCGDEPTAINPVTTPTPQASTPDLTAKDLPAPMINLQNAPAAPDPTGLTAALQLLGTKDLFRDVTGLAKNQENATAALSSTLSTAQAFGLKAADLLKMDLAQKNGGKTLQMIDQARKQGLISKDQAQGLAQDVLRVMSGGSGSESTTTEKLKAVDGAAEQGSITPEQQKDLTARILSTMAGPKSMLDNPAISTLLNNEDGAVSSASFEEGDQKLELELNPTGSRHCPQRDYLRGFIELGGNGVLDQQAFAATRGRVYLWAYDKEIVDPGSSSGTPAGLDDLLKDVVERVGASLAAIPGEPPAEVWRDGQNASSLPGATYWQTGAVFGIYVAGKRVAQLTVSDVQVTNGTQQQRFSVELSGAPISRSFALVRISLVNFQGKLALRVRAAFRGRGFMKSEDAAMNYWITLAQEFSKTGLPQGQLFSTGAMGPIHNMKWSTIRRCRDEILRPTE